MIFNSGQNYSGDQIKENYLGGACGTHAEEEKPYRAFARKHERDRFKKPRRRGDDNIRVNVKRNRMEESGEVSYGLC